MSMQVPNLECELLGDNPTDYPTSKTQPLGTPFVWMHSIDIPHCYTTISKTLSEPLFTFWEIGNGNW